MQVGKEPGRGTEKRDKKLRLWSQGEGQMISGQAVRGAGGDRESGEGQGARRRKRGQARIKGRGIEQENREWIRIGPANIQRFKNLMWPLREEMVEEGRGQGREKTRNI